MFNKENKTIAIFSGYALPHLGGVERYTDNFCKQLNKNGYNVIIISSDYTFDNQYYSEENNSVYLKLPIYRLFSNRYPIIKLNKDYKNTIKILDNYKIDAIILNTRFFLTSMVGAKYGKRHNIPVFLIDHGSQHLTVDNKVLDFFGAIYEHCLTAYQKQYIDQYYGVSQGACDWQKHFHIQSSGIWYNSINDFSEDIELNKEKDNKIHILYAGRILKQKGIIELLNAFTKIEKEYDNVYLNIAGDGNLLEKVKQEYKSDKIHFLGKLDFEQLKELYSYTDIFVYAPIWPEGLPTSILEAGLMECAVIGSPQGGIKEVIDDKVNGLMINNEYELYNALQLLLENKDKRTLYAKALKEKIRNQFLWEKTAQKIISDINNYKK